MVFFDSRRTSRPLLYTYNVKTNNLKLIPHSAKIFNENHFKITSLPSIFYFYPFIHHTAQVHDIKQSKHKTCVRMEIKATSGTYTLKHSSAMRVKISDEN